MITRILAILLLAASSLASAAPPDSTPKPLKGDYQVYGGSLGDMEPPTPKDRKVAFMFTGPLAKDLFGQIGPDMKDTCGASPTHRERQRGDLSCTRDTDGYRCYFGLNVVTGKGMDGSTC